MGITEEFGSLLLISNNAFYGVKKLFYYQGISKAKLEFNMDAEISFQFLHQLASIVKKVVLNVLFFALYFPSVQYLHVLQDPKSYVTYPTAQVQPNSQVTDISSN